jgi:hypothetical protein
MLMLQAQQTDSCTVSRLILCIEGVWWQCVLASSSCCRSSWGRLLSHAAAAAAAGALSVMSRRVVMTVTTMTKMTVMLVTMTTTAS